MTKKRRKRHSPEQIVKKLRDADAMLNAGKPFRQRVCSPPQLNGLNGLSQSPAINNRSSLPNFIRHRSYGTR